MSVNAGIDTDDTYIRTILKEFKLVDMRNRYSELIETAIEKDLGYKEFLVSLLNAEEEGKKQRRTQRNIKAACFEGIKTIEEYDFSFHKYQNMQKIKELSTLQFLGRNENIIFIGKTGVGKSHIATGIGMKACEAGKKVLFVNALELINGLSKSASEGNLKESLKKLSKIDLIIIDELGYLKMDREKESIFFQLVRSRYEKKSVIITTNLELREWDEVFTSQLAATAILDRLVHHSHIIRMGVEDDDDSYRIKGKRKEANI
ncbi:IS21-like element helper ATPase IstB [Ruminiclostridium cellobioparum]|uniref:IS21-like element helper ATPase IstB n=1 Tax=Ruminiclostridium cellobioparum TaxID=29355 RepID=UPI0028A6F5AB|nr:IS21-like element helper ATPase IstB [Ruminiclostridium cellobioparum]